LCFAERQKLEQKQRKEEERRRWKDDSSTSHWADKTANVPQTLLPSGSNSQYQLDLAQPEASSHVLRNQDRRASSAPEDARNLGAEGDSTAEPG
jgi:hypothetical protein